MSRYTTLRKRLRVIERMANDAEAEVVTMYSINYAVHLAIKELSKLEAEERDASDNVLIFRLRESAGETSHALRAIVDASNN